MTTGNAGSDEGRLKRDGGKAAIAGFLYQLVATLGMATWVLESPKGADGWSSDLELIIAAVRKNGAIPEQHDADAVVVGAQPGDAVLVFQMKYSGTVPPREIEPAELRAICDAFAKQRSALKEKEGRTVDRFVLITNRGLSRDANKAYAAARDGEPQSGDKWDKKWTDEQRAVLHLVVQPGQSHPGYWEEALHRYGASLGATREETSEGADQLIGAIFGEIAGGEPTPVTPARLASAITATERARCLRPRDIAPTSRESAERHLERACGAASTIPRTALMEALNRAADGAALIVLHGLGGDGKTVAASQWLVERAGAATTHALAFSDIASAGEIQNWPRQAFRNWADVADTTSSWPTEVTVETLVSRCAIAAGALHEPANEAASGAEEAIRRCAPLFTLALDGVDENVVALAEVGNILRWFSTEHQRMRRAEDPRPRGILLVTCRREKDVRELLNTDISGFGAEAGDFYSLVPADAFDVEELLGAAEQLDASVAKRLRRTLLYEDRFSGSSAFAPETFVGILGTPATGGQVWGRPAAGEDTDVPPALPEIAQALRHPAMWGAFQRLPDDQMRHSALDGTDKGKRLLALEFVRWAMRKWQLRQGAKPSAVQGAVANLVGAVEIVVQQCSPGERPVEAWSQAFDPAYPYPGGVAELLRNLSLSGLIDLDRPNWNWKHSFVADVMASKTARDELSEWAADL